MKTVASVLACRACRECRACVPRVRACVRACVWGPFSVRSVCVCAQWCLTRRLVRSRKKTHWRPRLVPPSGTHSRWPPPLSRPRSPPTSVPKSGAHPLHTLPHVHAPRPTAIIPPPHPSLFSPLPLIIPSRPRCSYPRLSYEHCTSVAQALRWEGTAVADGVGRPGGSF